MKTYKVNIKIEYYHPYIPYRCRKTRYEEREETINVPVRMITSEEAPIAFRLTDYGHTSDQQDIIRCYKKKLYKQVRLHRVQSCNGKNRYQPIPSEEVYRCLWRSPWTYNPEKRNREFCIKFYKEQAADYLIIDGYVWERAGEPRYVINTFGLGHNHGGTGMFVEEWYNPNISNKNYFSALDGDKAVAYANEVAARRGDTKDVGKFEKMIDVLMPECVHIKPKKQHGDGDPFINTLNSITENSSSAAEAGILAMCFAFAQ